MNYVAKTLESWSKPNGFAIGLTEDYGDFKTQAFAKNLQTDLITAGDFLQYMQNTAQHYYLPSHVLPFVWETAITPETIQGCRLPFDNIIIELDMDYELMGWGNCPEGRWVPRQRIICASQSEEGILLQALFRCQPDVIPNTGILSEWQPAISGVLIENSDIDDIVNHYWEDGEGNYTTAFRTCPGLFTSLYTWATEERGNEPFHQDTAEEVRILLGLLAILNCDNAPVAEVPFSEKLNKKRLKNNKPGYKKYKTLKITEHVHRGGTRIGASGKKSTHWRRGHIRNQPTAKGTVRKWIKPTIINSGDSDAIQPEIVLT